MKRICPRCQNELKDNCYVKDIGKSSLSYLQLIIQNDEFSKESKEIKSCYCQQCGYVELYVDMTPSPQDHTVVDHQELLKTVEKYANEYRQRTAPVQEQPTRKRHIEKRIRETKKTFRY